MAVSDKPLWAAAAAVAGTIGLGTVVVHQWIVPTMTAGLQFEIQSLKAERDRYQKISAETVDENKRRIEEIATLRKNNDENELRKSAQIELLKKQLFTSQMAGIFQVGSPYPIGLDLVKIGQPKSKIRASYPNANISEKGRATAVELPSGPLTKIIFFHSENQPDDKELITSIRYSADNLKRIIKGSEDRVDSEWVESSLSRVLGRAYVIGRDDDCLLWRRSDKELVFYQRGADWYFISGYTSYPAGCEITDQQVKHIEEQLKSRNSAAKADTRLTDSPLTGVDAAP